MDIIIDDMMKMQGVPYNKITDYFQLVTGTHNIKIQANNANYVNVQVKLEPNTNYTIVVMGSTTSTTSAQTKGGIQSLLIKDENQCSALGSAEVRLIHASIETAAIDIFVGGVKQFENLNYGEFTKYIQVPKSMITLQFKLTGQETLLYEAIVDIKANSVYSLILTGAENSDVNPIKLLDAIDNKCVAISVSTTYNGYYNPDKCSPKFGTKSFSPRTSYRSPTYRQQLPLNYWPQYE